MLIVAMLVWPSGIQGGIRAFVGFLRGAVRARGASGTSHSLTEQQEGR